MGEASSPQMAITNEVAALYRKNFGRGPMKARAHILDRLVVVTLAEGATPQERVLLADSGQDLVKATRVKLRDLMSDELKACVERHTGRRVEGLLSDFHPELDLAVLVFPLGEPGT